jgi:radical SAM protein with 4Fe4S-binding SPASM domain
MTNPEYVEDTEIYINHFCQEEVPLPTLAVIEISSRCNLSCVMCPRSLGKSPTGGSGDISLEAFDRLESLFPHLDDIVLSWIGEPLLHPQLGWILERVRACRANGHITSNGMLLDDEMAELLVSKGLDGLAISVDAVDEQLYRRIRRGGDLARVQENIRRVQRVKRRHGSQRPRLRLTFVAMSENADQFLPLVQLADRLGIREVTFGLVDDFGLTEDYQAAYENLPAATVRESFHQARQIARQRRIGIGIESSARFYHIVGEPSESYRLDDIYFQPLDRQQVKALGFRRGCAIPWVQTFISHTGDVHPCCIADVVLGNIYEQPFEAIWTGSAYREFRRRLRSNDPPEICWRCRRTIWNGSHRLDELRDTMKVGAQEVHGLGWKEIRTDRPGGPFRLVAQRATVFLRNSSKPGLEIEVGTHIAKVIAGRLLVNDTPIGDLRIRPGWQTIHFPLPPLEGDMLKVKLVTDYRDASVAVRRIALAEQLGEGPFHRAVTRSGLFKTLLDAWRVGGLYARHGAKVVLEQLSSLLDRHSVGQ